MSKNYVLGRRGGQGKKVKEGGQEVQSQCFLVVEGFWRGIPSFQGSCMKPYMYIGMCTMCKCIHDCTVCDGHVCLHLLAENEVHMETVCALLLPPPSPPTSGQGDFPYYLQYRYVCVLQHSVTVTVTYCPVTHILHLLSLTLPADNIVSVNISSNTVPEGESFELCAEATEDRNVSYNITHSGRVTPGELMNSNHLMQHLLAV